MHENHYLETSGRSRGECDKFEALRILNKKQACESEKERRTERERNEGRQIEGEKDARVRERVTEVERGGANKTEHVCVVQRTFVFTCYKRTNINCKLWE